MNYEEMLPELKKEKLPKHIAIIMDGNGRWAKKNNTKRVNGHREGVTALRRIVEAASDAGIKVLTVYAFSTENWGRSKTEVSYLLKLIMDSLIKEIDELNENNVRIQFIGTKEKLDESYNKKVMQTCKKSWNNSGLKLNIAMNYGGRKEITDAFNEIHDDIITGKIEAPITENLINNYLYTANFPDVDLVIRTSGEERLSNFLIWQSAYAEFWFTKTLWPDFTAEEFIKAIMDYQNRKRRFGRRK